MTALPIDPQRTALLALDFLTPILEHYASSKFAAGDHAAQVCAAARGTACLIGHVTPTIMVDHTRPTAESVDFYEPMRPAADEARFTKPGVGAFEGTGVESWLRRSARDTLVIMGVATSGTVLSTVRYGFDKGFRMIVVSDACSDMDSQVHEILTHEVDTASWIGLWKMAELMTTEQIVGQLTR